MPKYKKCPRCEINYILEDEDYCEICKEELRGISHNEEFPDDEEDAAICPRCKVNYLNEGEKICESCAAEMEEEEEKRNDIDDVEPDWGEEEEDADASDELDDDMDLSLECLAEEE